MSPHIRLLGRVSVMGRDVLIELESTTWVVAGDAMYRARDVALTPDEADALARGLHLAAETARRPR